VQKLKNQSITKKEMGDKSTISIIKDTFGKTSHAYNDAHNVKNYKGKAIDGR